MVKANFLLIKVISFTLIVGLLLTLWYNHKIFYGDFMSIMVSFFGCYVAGLYLREFTPKENIFIQGISWGLIYGAITLFILAIILIIVLLQIPQN